MQGKRVKGRRRGAYLSEKLVGFRMTPEKYSKLKREADNAEKTVAQLINEILDEKFGWTPAVEKPKKTRSKK